jgi:hypothetical protein
MPTTTASTALAHDFPPGDFTLLVAAADEDGRFGAPYESLFVADVQDTPPGELVIGLYWEAAANLDLHVVAPDTNGNGKPDEEAWTDDPNTIPAPVPGDPVDPNEWRHGGILDHDGNKACDRDVYPFEHVTWNATRCAPDACRPPPAGTYVVRVDARSMCGAPVAAWHVVVTRGDELVGVARGISTPADVLAPYEDGVPLGRGGAGTTALRFDCAATGCTKL